VPLRQIDAAPQPGARLPGYSDQGPQIGKYTLKKNFHWSTISHCN
jgi:hypothetical protein